MAFNINAQVILSGPKNIKTVTNKIQKQLGGITATVNLKVAKGTSRSVATLNRHVAALNKNLATLQGAATGANTALASLGTNLKTVNAGGSRFVQTQNKVNNSLKQTNSQLKDASYSMDEFGKESARAIRRFGAFTVATGTVFGFIRAVQSATKEALIFERELVKLEQITGRGGKALNDIRKSVDDLSKSLGIDANELLKIGKTFAQTGQTLDQVKRSMEAVARASLAPTFGTMASTTEGLIAAMAQFNIKAADSEKVLGSLNAVSKKFAVESSDLISAVRRAGGVFAATSNQVKEPIQSLNELIAIFTAVRSTTRETADTIATGLRTIFSRIQRPRTIEFLKQFGIELLDLKGNFKGTFESFQELSNGLKTIIAQGDVLKLAQITEELGGIRQVGKLIPAIKNFDKSLQALEVASKGAADGLGNDVRLALQPLGKQFERVAAQFNTLIRDVSQSRSFQQFARVALETASALISVADALRPLIPMITTLASIRIARGAFGFAQGFVSEFRGGGGAAGLGGRLGGAVTGGGGAQQIAAQHSSTRAINALSSSLKANSVKLGTNNTALGNVHTSLRVLTGRVNDLIIALRTSGGGRGGTGFVPIGGGGPRGGNPSGSRGRRPGRARGFAAGGRVGNTLANNLTSGALQKKVYRGDLDDKLLSGRAFNAEDRFSNKLNYRSYPSRIPKGYTGTGRQLSPTQFERYVAWRQYQFEKRGSGLRSLAKSKTAPIDIPSTGTEVKRIGSIGNIGDAAMRDKVIRALKGPGKQLDFQGVGHLKKNWKVRSGNQKWTAGADQISIPDIEIAYANSNRISRTAAGRIGLTRKAKGLQSGGNVFQPQGTDTVPAMLTPGEFVINRQSAERIGYGNLSDMNRLAKGGVARSSKTQYFANGTTGIGGLGHPGSMPGVTKATTQVNKNLGVMSSRMATVTSNLVGLGFALTTLDFTSLKGVMDSFVDQLPLIALTVGPQLISGLTQLGTQGARAGAALGTIGKGLGVAGLVSLVADPIAQSITNSIFGTLQERTTRRSGTLTAYEDAATTGATQGALSGGAKGAGAGFLVGSLFGPPGQLVGAIAGGIIGAVEGVFSGSALEVAAQRQADSLRRLTTESRALEKIFKELAEEGPDLGRGGEAKAREGFADAHRMRQRIQEDLGTVRHEQRSAGPLDDIAAFAETFFNFNKLLSPFESMAQIKSKEEYMENRGGRLKAFKDMLKTDAIKGTMERGQAVMEQGAGAQTTAALRKTTNTAATTVTNLGELEFHIGELLNEAKNATTDEDKGVAMVRVNALSQYLERLSQQDAPVTGGQVTRAMQLSHIPDVAVRRARADSIKEERAEYVQLQFATLQVQENLQTLKLAFETFGKALDQEMQQLNASMQEGASSISDLSSSVIQMRNMPFADVVNNLETASRLDITNAVRGVDNISGGSRAFEGVEDLLIAKQSMPDILRSVVQTVATQTRAQSARAAVGDAGFISQGKFISDALVEELGSRGLVVPQEVSDAIKVGLTESFARQGIKGSPVEILQAEGANITQKAFGSQEALLEAFGKVSQALNDYKVKLLDIGNLHSKVLRDQINNELQINRKRFDIEDRVNRVRGDSTRPGTARDRLMTQVSTVLGRDARGVDLPGRLAEERTELEGERDFLNRLFAASIGREEQKKVAVQLHKNTDALNRNKQATEMLANDVTVLAELEQRAAKANRQELGAQAGILGFSEATDKLLSGTREGFEAFANFTAPINALIKASHNQILRPDEARGLIQGIQSNDPILSTFLDNLPDGENQAKELKQNLVRNLAQDTAMKLSRVGGAPGTYAQLLPMLEKAYTAALDRKTGIAGEMEAIGREQNRLLADSMKIVTDAALDVFAGMITELDRTFDNIVNHIGAAGDRRGNVQKLPNINAALQSFDRLLGSIRSLVPMTQNAPSRMGPLPAPNWRGGVPSRFDPLIRSLPERVPIPPGRKKGGKVESFAQGGYVRGPSHGAGGVMANLEGGEYVVPKKYAKGGVAYLQGGGSGFPSQSSANYPKREDNPLVAGFVDRLKYYAGFQTPEYEKMMAERNKHVVSAHNPVIDMIGGGTSLLKSVTKIPSLIKNVPKVIKSVPSMIKNLPGKIMGRRGTPSRTVTVPRAASTGSTKPLSSVEVSELIAAQEIGSVGLPAKLSKASPRSLAATPPPLAPALKKAQAAKDAARLKLAEAAKPTSVIPESVDDLVKLALGKKTQKADNLLKEMAKAKPSPAEQAAQSLFKKPIKDPKIEELVESGLANRAQLDKAWEVAVGAGGRDAARAKQVASIVNDPKVLKEALGSMKGAKGAKDVSELGEAVLKAKKAAGAGKAASKAAATGKVSPKAVKGSSKPLTRTLPGAEPSGLRGMGQRVGGNLREMGQMLGEGPGPLTDMDRITFGSGIGTAALVSGFLSGPWGARKGPSKAAIKAREKLGGDAPAKASTKEQQKLIKDKTIAAAKERSQKIQDDVGPGTHQERMDDIERRREAVLAGRGWPGLIQRKAPEGSMRAMGVPEQEGDKTPSQLVSEEFERRKKAIEQKYSNLKQGDRIREQAEAMGLEGMGGGGMSGGMFNVMDEAASHKASHAQSYLDAGLTWNDAYEQNYGDWQSDPSKNHPRGFSIYGPGGESYDPDRWQRTIWAGGPGGPRTKSQRERAQRADEIQAQKRNNAERRRERLARRKRRSEPGGMIGIEDRVNRLLGGGRGRQAAAYRGGLTVEQKEDIQRKRRQKLQDARARQQARQDAELKRQNAASEELDAVRDITGHDPKKTSSMTMIMTARGPTTLSAVESETVGGHTTYRTGRNPLMDPDTDVVWSRGTTRTGKDRTADVSSKEQRRPGVKRRGQRGLPYGHPQEETPSFKEWKKERDRQKAEKRRNVAGYDPSVLSAGWVGLHGSTSTSDDPNAGERHTGQQPVDYKKGRRFASLADRTHMLRMEKVREQDQNIGRRPPLGNEQGPRGPHAYSQVSKLQRRRGTSPYSQVSKGQQSYHRRRGASSYSQASRGQQSYHRRRGASPYSQVRRGQQRYHRRRARGYAAGGMALPGQMMDMQQQAFGSLAGSASSAFGGLYGAHAAAANFNPFAFNPASMFALTGGYNTPFGTVGGGQFQNPGYTYNLAGGGSIFKPKGTDTVPAMLTPGEFVVNAGSARKVGYGTLSRINNMANGGTVPSPQYLQGGGGATEGADVAAKLAESQASMNKLSEALGKIPEVINIELKQNGIVKVALDEQFVPQVKKYFEQWANEKLNGAGRADDSNVDTSMHNDYSGGSHGNVGY